MITVGRVFPVSIRNLCIDRVTFVKNDAMTELDGFVLFQSECSGLIVAVEAL